MKKQLPIFNTPIQGVQYFALSIIFSDEQVYPWFFCNYIQLEWMNNNEIINRYITFSLFEESYIGIPFLHKQIFIREVITDSDIIRFLIRNVDAGWYTQLCLDEFFLPDKESFNREHFSHDNMVCGYDTEKETFTLFGYDKNEALNQTTASFEQIRNAYLTTDNELFPVIPGSFSYGNLIFLLKKNEAVHYEIDLECIKEQLAEYLSGTCFANRNRMIYNPSAGKIYGIRIYDELIKEFQNHNQTVTDDIRLLHTIYEHKRVMVLRVEYLKAHHYLPADMDTGPFRLLESNALKARNLQLKYLLLHDLTLLDKITAILANMKEAEQEAIGELIGAIHSTTKGNFL